MIQKAFTYCKSCWIWPPNFPEIHRTGYTVFVTKWHKWLFWLFSTTYKYAPSGAFEQGVQSQISITSILSWPFIGVLTLEINHGQRLMLINVLVIWMYIRTNLPISIYLSVTFSLHTFLTMFMIENWLNQSLFSIDSSWTINTSSSWSRSIIVIISARGIYNRSSSCNGNAIVMRMWDMHVPY